MSNILFDKIYNNLLTKFGEIFTSTFVNFTKSGIEINVDESIEYINKIIEDTQKIEPEDMTSKEYIILCVCYFVCALLSRFDEEDDEEIEEVTDGN